MEFREFLNAMFSRPAYREVTDSQKKEWAFLTMKVISVKFPYEANLFNVPKVNKVNLMDAWHAVLCSRYPSRPQWTFAQQSYKGEKKDGILKGFTKKLILAYLSEYEMDARDLNFLADVAPDVVKAELKEYEHRVKEAGGLDG